MTPRILLRALAVTQLLVAAFLWDHDRAIGVVFALIAVGLYAASLPRTPTQKRRSRR